MTQELQLDTNALTNLLALCLNYANQKSEDGNLDVHDLANKVGAVFGVDNIDKFAKDQFKNAMESGLGQAFDSSAAKPIAAVFANSCKPVMKLVYSYAKGGSSTDLVKGLNKECLKNAEKLAPILQEGLGVPEEAAKFLSNKCGPYLVSIYAFAGAYKIYCAAAQDAALAHEQRLEAERMANEAVAQLKAQRAEFDDMLGEYLYGHLLPFNEGIAAMDKAILEGDDEGFIKANAQLWELFGRDAQYHSASEFDDLMLSDEAFRL